MVIAPEPFAAAPPAPSSRVSLTTGTNIGAASAGNVTRPARAALRQANRCCGNMSCRRATSDTTAPGTYDSATIRPFASPLQRRRPPTPTLISTRPRGAEASTISSTIYANRSAQVGSHLVAQIARYKVRAEDRLRSSTMAVEESERLAPRINAEAGCCPAILATPKIKAAVISTCSPPRPKT